MTKQVDELDTYPTDDLEDQGPDLHSLPSADEVKNLQQFVEGETKKKSAFDFGFSRKQMYILGGFAGLLFMLICKLIHQTIRRCGNSTS